VVPTFRRIVAPSSSWVQQNDKYFVFCLTTEDLITLVILLFGLEFRKERGRIQETEGKNSQSEVLHCNSKE
jgi:hypothetical protein